MAFLFQDQNQGIRNDAPRGMRLSRPFSFIRTLTVGFGIAPNLLTLRLWERRRSRAWAYPPLPPVGTFTPPWEHRPPGMSGLRELCRSLAPSASRLAMDKPHVPHDIGVFRTWSRLRTSIRLRQPIRRVEVSLALRNHKARIRFRFVLAQIVNAERELWTSSALPVDGLAVPLRGFRKSHHLICGTWATPSWIAIGGDASCQRILAWGMRSKHRIW